MAGYKGKQGRKPKASTIVERQREQGWEDAKPGRLPTAPRYLTKIAKAEWRRIGRLLKDAGLLTDLDTTALGAYCAAYSRHVEAESMLQGPQGHCVVCDPRLEDVQSDVASERQTCRAPFHTGPEFGMVIKGRLGKVGPSPFVAIANQAMTQMIRFLGEFGMTPASRSRIPKNQDPERRPRSVPDPGEKQVDPREAFNMAIQASKN